MPSAANVSSGNMKRPVRSSSSNELQALLLGCAKDDGKEMMGRRHHHHQEGGRGGGRAAFDEIWSSIIAASNNLEKQAVDHKDGSSSDPHAAAAYIHPTVKTSSSTLSEKSLDICTESLGSETGSDGFSSYPASPPQRTDKGERRSDDQDQWQHQPSNVVVVVEETIMKEEEAVSQVPKYNCCSSNNSSSNSGNAILLSGSSGGGGSRKRSSAVPAVAARRSFPPPLPSLALCEGGSNLIHLRSHRQNGRLVLEAVSVPISQKCFRAQRQDGRLLLTLATTNTENNEQAILEEEIIDEHGLAGNEPTNSESESEEEGGEEERIFDKDVKNRHGHGLALIMGEEDEKDTVLIIGKWPRGFVTINMQINNISFGWHNYQYPHNRPSNRFNSDYSYHYFGSASTRRPFLTQGFTSTGSSTASERSKSLRITTKS